MSFWRSFRLLSSSSERYFRFSGSVPDVSPTRIIFIANSPKTFLKRLRLFERNWPFATSFEICSNILRFALDVACRSRIESDSRSGTPAFTRKERRLAKSACSWRESRARNVTRERFENFCAGLLMNNAEDLFECGDAAGGFFKTVLDHRLHAV